MSASPTHLPDHDQPGMDPQPHREQYALLPCQAGIQGPHRVHSLETRPTFTHILGPGEMIVA
jgi:hypothetical protein